MCLPINNGLSAETFLGIRCVATGWGQMAVGGKLQTKLREVELRVIDNKHCRDMYGLMHNIAIQNYHLCAGPILQGGKGTCIVRRHILSNTHIQNYMIRILYFECINELYVYDLG